MKRVLLPLMLLGLATGCPTDDDTNPPDGERVDDILALSGDATSGSAVYAARCQSCHNSDGSGGIGPSLLEYVPANGDTDILTIVLEGEGTMPSASDLDDQDLADLLAHLNTAFGG